MRHQRQQTVEVNTVQNNKLNGKEISGKESGLTKFTFFRSYKPSPENPDNFFENGV